MGFYLRVGFKYHRYSIVKKDFDTNLCKLVSNKTKDWALVHERKLLVF